MVLMKRQGGKKHTSILHAHVESNRATTEKRKLPTKRICSTASYSTTAACTAACRPAARSSIQSTVRGTPGGGDAKARTAMKVPSRLSTCGWWRVWQSAWGMMHASWHAAAAA